MAMTRPKRVVVEAGLATPPETTKANPGARVTIKSRLADVTNHPVDPRLDSSMQVLRARHPVAKRIVNLARTG